MQTYWLVYSVLIFLISMSVIYIKFYVICEWDIVINGVRNTLYYYIVIPLIINPFLPLKNNIPDIFPSVI